MTSCTVDLRSLRWIVERLQVLQASKGNLHTNWLGLADVQGSLGDKPAICERIDRNSTDTLQVLRGAIDTLYEANARVKNATATFRIQALCAIQRYHLDPFPQDLAAVNSRLSYLLLRDEPEPGNEPTTVDQTDLRWVTRRFKRLEYCGGNLSANWLELADDLSGIETRSWDETRANEIATETLQALVGAITFIKRVHAHLIKLAMLCYRDAAPPKMTYRGLASLPQELLVYIRLLLHKDVSDSSCGPTSKPRIPPQCPLQLVSRQFRSLELSIPELWTHVNFNKMRSDCIRLQMNRSGSLKLSFSLAVGKKHSRMGGFLICMCVRLAILAQNRHRWSRGSFSIYDIDPYPGENKNDHTCLTTLDNLTLPSLDHLESDFVCADAAGTVCTWSLPNLKRLRVHQLEDMLPFLQKTTALDTLEWYFDAKFFSAPQFLESLAHPSLYHLRRLEVNWTNVSVKGATVNPQFPVQSLVNLSEFSFNVPNYEPWTFPNTTIRLFQCIRMPNLRTIFLKYNNPLDKVSTLSAWLEDMGNPSLRKAEVIIEGCAHSSQPTIRKAFTEALLADRNPTDLILDISFED